MEPMKTKEDGAGPPEGDGLRPGEDDGGSPRVDPNAHGKRSAGLASAAAWAGLASVTVLAALPFWADWRSEARVPTSGDLGGAVEAVRARFEAGDAIRVEPSWWTLPWQALTGLGPEATTWPFPALLMSEELDPMEALGRRRLFVVAGFGREATLPPLLGGNAVGPGEEVFTSETVDVRVHTLPEVRRLKTLGREWQSAVVGRRFGPGERLTPCPFKNGKHRCGRDSWMDVAPEPRVVGRREVNWLFVHPGPVGSELELTWRGLPGETERGPTWLFVRAGPSLEAVRHGEGDEVVVETLIGSEVVDRFALAPLAFEMERRAVSLAGRGASVDVTLRIHTSNPAWRETLLEADVLDALPDVARSWANAVVE